MDVGVEINQYRVVEHIGRGGMADVWSARDTRLNRMVAIKTIAHGLSTPHDPVAMFKREAQTIAQMEHPHILPIYDFGDFEGKLYIVMRYVTGGALDDLLELRGSLPIEEALRMGRSIAQALDYAHTNNIVHLDLKPQNILLDSMQSPYLADFGLATKLDREGRAENPGSGTLMYISPEQLTSEIIDKRADIYSFSVVMYHILSGHLPFEGSVPLAMKQLQFQEDLPSLDNLPAFVTEILRRGVAVDLDLRPSSLTEMVQELETVLAESVDLSGDFGGMTFDDPYGDLADSADMDLLEAIDIYSRAKFAWAGGQGRFLPGVTHFMLMNDYYMNADKHGLQLDSEGRQMLLRGAIEYDRDINYWWTKLDVADRRWVCLHAIRSESAPARIRALYRLETMPDTEAQRIPRLVAQGLQLETDESAQLAALQVLATRAKLVKPQREFDIRTEYRGLMLTTLTRIDVQLIPDVKWYDTVYSHEIDTLLAELAFDAETQTVRDFAARVIGRIRSVAAVKYIMEQPDKASASTQAVIRRRAMRALALIRDETPRLPPVVSRQARLYAWLTNTWRRLTETPLQLTWRFLFAMLGGAIGMAIQVFGTFRSEAIFNPQRISNAYAFGLAFGLVIAIHTLMTDEVPSRLRGFWSWTTRLVWSVGFGLLLGMLAWGLVNYLYFYQQNTDWDLMFFGGAGLAVGLVLNTLLNLRGWLAFLLTAAGIFLPIYAVWNNHCWQLNACAEATPPFSIAPVMLIGLLIGLAGGVLLRLQTRRDNLLHLSLPVRVQVGASVLAGAAWGIASWLILAQVFSMGGMTWAGVIGLMTLNIAGGGLVYWLQPALRTGYAAGSIAAVTVLMFILNGVMQSAPFLPPANFTFLLYYDTNAHLFTATLPFAIFTALGAHALILLRDARRLPAWWDALRAAQVGGVSSVESLPVESTETPEYGDQMRTEFFTPEALPTAEMDEFDDSDTDTAAYIPRYRSASSGSLNDSYDDDDESIRRLQDEDK